MVVYVYESEYAAGGVHFEGDVGGWSGVGNGCGDSEESSFDVEYF